MNLKNLESAAKMLEEVKKLDQQIIQIEKFAMLVANGEIKSSVELKVEDLGKKKEDAGKIGFDEDGSLVMPRPENIVESWFKYMHRGHGGIFYDGSGLTSAMTQPNKNDHFLKYELSETATMQILGVLLAEKQSVRNDIISKLRRFGVDI